MQVHDELVFDVVKDEKKLLKIEIVDIMENILKESSLKFKYLVNLKVDL